MHAYLIRSLRLLGPVTAVGLAGLVAGCGGAVYSAGVGTGDSGAGDSGGLEGGSGDAGSHDSGTLEGGNPDASGDDSSTPWSPVCPDTQPTVGTSCTNEQLECEYGESWWSVACDPVVQCQSGQWASYQPSFEPCSAKPGPNPAACPATYADVPQGSTCKDTSLSCVYANAECSCQKLLGGPVQIDGGNPASWGCLPEQGCPFPRPRIGTACSSEGTSCTYEECSYGQTCQDGTWQGEEEGCAVPGGQGTGSP